MIVATTDATPFPFEPLAQYTAKTPSDPSINGREGLFASMFEVCKPSNKSSVHIQDDRFKAVTVASPGFIADCVPEFRDALLPRPPWVPIESVSQEVECFTAFREINDLRLVRMQGQSSLLNQSIHQGERGLSFTLVLAQDHKIIRISDHPIPRFGHCKINRVEVQVGEQRAYYRPLRRTAFRSPAVHCVKNIRFEKAFQQFEHTPVRDIFADLFHEQVVRNTVKIGFYVRIHHMDKSGLKKPVHFPKGILTSESWPESKAHRRKLPLEDGLHYQAQSALDHPVTHAGNPKRPLVFTSRLVYVDSPDGSRAINPRTQFLFEPTEVCLKVAFEILDALMVRSGTAPVRSHSAPCGLKRCRAADLVKQAKPYVAFHPSCEGIQHALCPYGPFDPIRLYGTGLSRLFSRTAHSRGYVFIPYAHSSSIFLHPFAPQALPCINATTGTLTPAWLALRTLLKGNEHKPCSGQVSLLHMTRFSMHSVTNHPARPVTAFTLSTQRDGLPESTLMGSPGVSGLEFTPNELARRIAWPKRVRHMTRFSMHSVTNHPAR